MRLFVLELSGHYIIVHEIIVVSIVWYLIRIVLCVKSSVSLEHIVSAYESYETVCILYKSYRIVKLYVSYDT